MKDWERDLFQIDRDPSAPPVGETVEFWRHEYEQATALLSDALRDERTRNEDLTRQLDDARDKAINAGIFTSLDDDESKYTHALNTVTCEGCGDRLSDEWCYRCETEISTPGATSYKP